MCPPPPPPPAGAPRKPAPDRVNVRFFSFPSDDTAADSPESCMSTWLANAGLPRNLTSNLWQAKLDEANIPGTKPALLAFVVHNKSPVEQKRAQGLQNCMGRSIISKNYSNAINLWADMENKKQTGSLSLNSLLKITCCCHFY